ncbi:MAG: signal peptidase I, partial [Coriobacteriales bacterium]|nr:signal peptidase I [Coriobacteriales bacterium]
NPKGWRQGTANPYADFNDVSRYNSRYSEYANSKDAECGAHDSQNASSDPKSKSKKKRGLFGALGELVIIIAAAMLFAFLICNFVIQPFVIPSGSMESTINISDRVLAEKISYHFGKPQPGQIVTFVDPDDSSRILIKRCIATQGQEVDIRNNKLYIDGVEQHEDYTHGLPNKQLLGGVEFPYTVPPDHIFVMGDNRTNSQDSRYFGAIPISSVTGHAICIYWPLNRLGSL